MSKSIHIGVILCLFMSGFGHGSTEFVRVERLSDRVLLGYWLGTGRTNLVAIKSQKGLAIIDTEMSPRIMAPIKERIEKAFGRDDWAYVINTHAHMHHAGGNCLFKDAVIIGHDKLPEDMQWLIQKQIDETWKRKELDNNAETIRNLQVMLPKVKGSRLQTRRIQGEIRFYQLNTQDMEEGLTLEQARERFAVRKKFPRFFQRQSAQWSKAKQDRNINVLWRLLKEANQQSESEESRK